MYEDSLTPCPFCGSCPVRYEDVSPILFKTYKDEGLIYAVSCATNGCPPSGVLTTNISWNNAAHSKAELRGEILNTLMAESDERYDIKRREFGLFAMSH